MSKGLFVSKGLAIGTAVLTLSAVGGIITMAIVYQMQIDAERPTKPTAPPTTAPIPTGPPLNLRLPRNLVPKSYDIILWPRFYPSITNETNQTFIFTGNSTVTFECLNKTRSIFLHSKDLHVTNPVLRRLDIHAFLDVKLYVNESTVSETNFLEVQLVDNNAFLEQNGTYSLFMEFEGELLNDLSGFYRSQYELKEANDTRYLAATQMQATDARKVFPCFDEPDMKAEFQLTLIHRKGTGSLANWPLEASSGVEIELEGERWIVSEFKRTQKMSTYLMAFVVSDFKCESNPAHERDIKVWARPEAIDAGHADYAMRITEKILDFFEKEFELPYPVSKLDQIALPDLAPSAMENWGLITYRESDLLFVEGVSSIINKDSIATVIAHELAHQWFGNLVTMKWWNEVWLNEGFATFMSYQGVKHVEPTLDTEGLFVIAEVQSAFQVDALASSHPLSPSEEEIQTLVEINELFDSISYSKGAAVLRMLSHYIGKRTFEKGIKMYLKALQYGNAEQKDLWHHLQQAFEPDGQEVKEIMSTWTEQKGYPIVMVDTSSGRISQEEFLLNQTWNHDAVWRVPVTAIGSDKKELLDRYLLAKAGPEIKPELQSEEWILVNFNCTGYFRVNYNLENWQRLSEQLNTDHHAIPEISRGQLIDDAFNLARAEYVDVTLALDLTRYLRNETQFIPWNAALTNLQYFILMFDRSEVYGPMQTYLKKQVTRLYQHFENYTMNSTVPDSHTAQYAQLVAIEMACRLGLKDCIDMATGLFTQWKENNTRIHPNYRSSIYCNAIATGGEVEWDFAWETYLSSTIETQRNELRYALSCTKHIWLLNRYLQYTIDPSKIRKMQTVSTINFIAKNVAGQALAWDFVRAQWKYFSAEYGEEIMFLGNLIDGVTERFSTEYELEQLKQFQRDHTEDSLGSASRALEQAIERTEVNIKWVEENKGKILDWFRTEIKKSS